MKELLDLLRQWNAAATDWVGRLREESSRRLEGIEEAVRALRESSADPRLKALNAGIVELRNHLDGGFRLWSRDLLKELEAAIEKAGQTESEAGLARLIDFFRKGGDWSANELCQTLLDWLLERTGAQRGFILFYQPESSAANVVTARNYASTHLALAEYDLSRTLLGRVLSEGRPLLLEDACLDPHLNRQASIRRRKVLAVLAVPLQRGERTLGAIYLEDSRRPGAFSGTHQHLAEAAGVLLMIHLQAGGLLPALIGGGQEVVLDPGLAATDIVGRHPTMRALRQTIERIADAPATVLIQGESGTGKELVARALHQRSQRRDHPFVAINCAAIPESLLESELFGHERGAFTGAQGRYRGRLASAHRGTLFLDEVSELAYPMQAKLLRFLQSKEFQRLGGNETVRVDVRIVAATSKNLLDMAKAGRFQEALFFRLNVVPLEVPPLRQRRDDLEVLGRHFLQRYRRIYSKSVEVRPEVWECLRHYDFPGNVRELENVVHRLVALAGDEPVSVSDLPGEILPLRPQRVRLDSDSLDDLISSRPADWSDLRERRRRLLAWLADQEAGLAQRAVREAGSVTAAAGRLGIHRVTLHKVLKRAKDTVAGEATAQDDKPSSM
ncbi:MAG TPA: sigma 54-interacting transcriptional regulator [Acidobacteriota bacterium]|nr:sigma 54-interacting transcriptional regulator [Acidobacteriota bacterium]